MWLRTGTWRLQSIERVRPKKWCGPVYLWKDCSMLVKSSNALLQILRDANQNHEGKPPFISLNRRLFRPRHWQPFSGFQGTLLRDLRIAPSKVGSNCEVWDLPNIEWTVLCSHVELWSGEKTVMLTAKWVLRNDCDRFIGWKTRLLGLRWYRCGKVPEGNTNQTFVQIVSTSCVSVSRNCSVRNAWFHLLQSPKCQVDALSISYENLGTMSGWCKEKKASVVVPSLVVANSLSARFSSSKNEAQKQMEGLEYRFPNPNLAPTLDRDIV